MGLGNWLKRQLHRGDRRVLVLGLPGAGKTAAVGCILAAGAEERSGASGAPGAPLQVRVARAGGLAWHLWELDGSDRMRVYWPHHFAGAQGVLFVVDASARAEGARPSAALELAALAGDAQLAGVPIAVLVNKADVGVGVPALAAQLRAAAEGGSGGGRPVGVFPASATKGDGVGDALAFLAQHTKPL